MKKEISMKKELKPNLKLLRCKNCNYKHTKDLRVLINGIYVCPKCHEHVYSVDINQLLNQN